VLLTAGASEAIRLVTTALVDRGEAVIVGPTYSEYDRAVRSGGGRAVDVDASPPSFDPPIERALARLANTSGVLFLCDPNNPTGRALTVEELLHMLGSLPLDASLVLDQSFAPFASSRLGASECLAGGKVVLVRSLTKLLATPGLRLGYVIARPRTIAGLRAVQDPWAVGAHAIAAAMVASWTMPAEVRIRIASWRERLAQALTSRGLQPLPSETNFLLVHVGPAAAQLVAALAEQRIAVRWCASFGLPEYIRLAVRPPAEQDVLLSALAAISSPAIR
jgi:histidinol-phosphate/aromatic aminotransferase/cobyric acid decarboxylase-like protein